MSIYVYVLNKLAYAHEGLETRISLPAAFVQKISTHSACKRTWIKIRFVVVP